MDEDYIYHINQIQADILNLNNQIEEKEINIQRLNKLKYNCQKYWSDFYDTKSARLHILHNNWEMIEGQEKLVGEYSYYLEQILSGHMYYAIIRNEEYAIEEIMHEIIRQESMIELLNGEIRMLRCKMENCII